jgi:ARG and Rhodanese-Phosphatase-superfamily-associated Protein domain
MPSGNPEGEKGEEELGTGTKRMETISDLSMGKPQSAGALTMVPLSGNPAATLDYLLVDEALSKKEVLVEEVSEGGAVPEIRVTNFSGKTVLVVDGTELVGAKQNRIVNASFLIPPKSVTKIPVSCVEQGRWNYRGRNFKRSPHHAAHSIRKLNVMHHRGTLKSRQGYRSDQGRVWEAVACMSHEMAAPTTTGAMHDVYEQKKSAFEEFEEKVRAVRGQTGAAFLVGGSFAGLDLFDRPATLKNLFPKLLSAVAVEAMMTGSEEKKKPKTDRPPEEKVRAVLDEVASSLFEKYDPVGVGEDWRYEGKLSLGKALYFNGDLIHFSAFGK